MPLTGSIADRIHELTHHGTRPRSHKEIVAAATHSFYDDKKKHKNARIHTFVKSALDKRKGKATKAQTEPLKTPGVEEPVQFTRESLYSAITKAAERVHLTPSDAQRKAGNYRMGHVTVQGMDITIENPIGSTRKGKGKDGPWEVVMKHHYGYIKRTKSEADKDHVDVFIGSHPESQVVFVIDQNLGNRFDEHKCMIGFLTDEDAKKAYHDNYSEGWNGFANIRALTTDQFKKWVKKGHTHIPIAKQVLVFNAEPVKLGRLDNYGLLQRIAANPHDAAGHLILADSLEENGEDPFARLIRQYANGERQSDYWNWADRGPYVYSMYSPYHPTDNEDGYTVVGEHGPFQLYAVSSGFAGHPRQPLLVSAIPHPVRTRPRFQYNFELTPHDVRAIAQHVGGSVGVNLEDAARRQWDGQGRDEITRHNYPKYDEIVGPKQFARPLPDWVPQEDPDHPSPEKTGWIPVQSTWIAGLKMTPDRVTHMTVKKGGKTYDYPGINLAMLRRWVAARSPGKWWWRNIGYPMADHTPTKLSMFTGRVHPIFTSPAIDKPFKSHPLADPEDYYTYNEIMDWARRHVHPQITDAHLAALVGAMPGVYTHVAKEGTSELIGYGHQLAGNEPLELTFTSDAPGYSVSRTIQSRTASHKNTAEIHNDHMIVSPYVKEYPPGQPPVKLPNPFRGVSGPALLRQMRAAYEVGIPRIHWHSAWTTPEHSGDTTTDLDFSGGLHWPMIGADGTVPNFHKIPQIVVDDADKMSNGRFSQTWRFSDFFKSPYAKMWYERNPGAHNSFVDTTPGSYSRTAVERHVGENAARHGMEGPSPDTAMHQQPLPQNPAEAKMMEPEDVDKPKPVQMSMYHQRRVYHPAIEHLLATGSTHPEYFDMYFNK